MTLAWGNWRIWLKALYGDGFTWMIAPPLREMRMTDMKAITRPDAIKARCLLREQAFCISFLSDWLDSILNLTKGMSTRGMSVVRIMSLPSPNKGRRGIGIIAPNAEPAMLAK